MNKPNRILSSKGVILSTFLTLSGCGGGGDDTNLNQIQTPTNPNVEETISGSIEINDSIPNKKVEFIIDGKVLLTTTTDQNGNYKVKTSDLKTSIENNGYKLTDLIEVRSSYFGNPSKDMVAITDFPNLQNLVVSPM